MSLYVRIGFSLISGVVALWSGQRGLLTVDTYPTYLLTWQGTERIDG